MAKRFSSATLWRMSFRNRAIEKSKRLRRPPPFARSAMFSPLHIAIHAVIHAAWLLAASVCAAGWTGVAVYVSDPQGAWNGTSDCAPCNRLCADLAKAARGTKWRVGIGKVRADGTTNHFAVMRALPDEPTPYCEAILDGRSVRIIEGYTGDIAAINALYPGPTVPSSRRITTSIRTGSAGCPCPDCPCPDCPCPTQRTTTTIRAYVTSPPVVRSYTVSPPVVVSPPMYYSAPTYRSTNAYTPHWTWPGSLRSHLANTHGYSASWLATLSDDQVEQLHDRDHDSGRVTPWGQQRWSASQQTMRAVSAAPVYAASPSYGAIRSRSTGFSVLGVPIYRQWSSGGVRSSGNCPGGVCP